MRDGLAERPDAGWARGATSRYGEITPTLSPNATRAVPLGATLLGLKIPDQGRVTWR